MQLFKDDKMDISDNKPAKEMCGNIRNRLYIERAVTRAVEENCFKENANFISDNFIIGYDDANYLLKCKFFAIHCLFLIRVRYDPLSIFRESLLISGV